MTHKITVAVTLEIQVPDSWGRNCTLGQVFDQANHYAQHAINHAIKESKLKAKIVGKPVATAALVLEEKT